MIKSINKIYNFKLKKFLDILMKEEFPIEQEKPKPNLRVKEIEIIEERFYDPLHGPNGENYRLQIEAKAEIQRMIKEKERIRIMRMPLIIC